MFQALSDKVISGLISLSVMLFSSYEGNTARFADLETTFLQNRIIFKTALIDAFENDFEELFRSGQTIRVIFTVEIRENGELTSISDYEHSVLFDPLQQIYIVSLEDKKESLIIEDYLDLKNRISEFEYSQHYPPSGTFQIQISANLPPLILETSGNREFDTMMLWRFKTPRLRERISRPENES